MSSRPYTEFRPLRDIYLEDSWILAISASPGRVVFEAELVLCPGHADYSPPRQGEQHCYARGRLLFQGVTNLSWTEQGGAPARDVTGTVDHGNIDTLAVDQNRFELTGDFGRMVVECEELTVEIDEP